MEFIPTELPGLRLIRPRLFQDARGSFVKTYHHDAFREAGLDFAPREEFFSTSAKNVLRGMHFQLPPAAHAKLVYCVTGSALEVASLGEAFGGAVQSFGQSTAALNERLQGIEAALDKSLARSDEQLAYYVAQAREVVELSMLSQQQIIGELQQLAGTRNDAEAAGA